MISKIKRAALWYFLLKKRMLCRIGFILILLSVPVLTVLFTIAAEDTESGFLRIALATEDDSVVANRIADDLASEKGLIYYFKVSSPEEAKEMVKSQKADAAWIFEDDFEEKAEKYAKGKKVTLVTVCECESDNLLLAISRERIFSSVFGDIAYHMYKNAIGGLLPDEEISEKEFRETYNENAMKSDIMKFTFLNDKDKDVTEGSYLTSPLRGLLALIMLLCGMASTMYFLSDEKNGTFSFLAPEKRIYVFFATNTASVTLAGLVVGAALMISGIYENFWYESLIMLLYIISISVFCTVLGSVVSNLASFAVMLPIVLVVSLLASPVFFNLKTLSFLQKLLPPYHYLFAVEDSSVVLSMVIYCVLGMGLSYVAYRALCHLRLGRIAADMLRKRNNK